MAPLLPDQKPLCLFYAYAHEDERLRARLETALAPLRQQGLIREWHDRKISAGQRWRDEIDMQVEAADIILLLISPDFLASNYCYENEMKRALARHQEGTVRVVPIIVRTVDWKTSPLEKLQVLPKDGKPVDSWHPKDAAWADIAKGIRGIIQEFRQRQPSALLMQEAIKIEQHPHPFPSYALTQMEASQEGPSFPLLFDTTLRIGRDKQANIRLADDDKKASRYHCQIHWSVEGVVVFDLQSKNGTFVNEQRIDQAKLKPSDFLRCGRSVFRLEDVNATESEDADKQ